MQLNSPFSPASTQALTLAHIFGWVLAASAVVFLIVAGLVAYIAVRFRARPDGPVPKQDFGNVYLEVTWTLIPAALLAVFFVYTVVAMHSVDPPPGSQAPDVKIIAHQWWWEVRYPDSGVVTANEIHLPVGRDSLFEVTSADVVHDFWVPQLGRKIDAIPHHPNHLWMHPTQTGTYLGTCAEYCGAGHAWMGIRVIVQSPADFAAWLKARGQSSVAPTTAQAKAGAALFQARSCVNCHAIAGTPAKAEVGPDLTHVASRETLGAGVVKNTPETLRSWLRDPQAIKPGNHMPNLHLRDPDLDKLVAYLEELS